MGFLKELIILFPIILNDGSTIICDLYLEYKEFYLIIKDSERYIFKNSTKEIRKLNSKVNYITNNI